MAGVSDGIKRIVSKRKSKKIVLESIDILILNGRNSFLSTPLLRINLNKNSERILWLAFETKKNPKG